MKNLILNIKQKILKFSVKHATFIQKIIPNRIIKFCERKIMKNNTVDFERVKEFDKDFKRGINYVGPLKGQYGLGQGSRCLGNAVKELDMNSSFINVNLGMESKNHDTEFDSIISNTFKYNINLMHIQPYIDLNEALSQIKIDNLYGRYNIAYWVYELEDIPQKWFDSFKYVNEIWTASKFVTDAFKKVVSVPVYTMPYGIKVSKNEKLTRKDFDIPEDKFTYLLLYDPKSLPERKNPEGAINAFINAFENTEDVCLVIKVNNAEEKHLNHLKEKLKDVKNYRIINKLLEKEDVYSLISLCDVFISLHRSEGFGLVMAEAMALGTVCVATNYSGNVDFMNRDNSCLVDYKMIEVDTSNQIVYEKGNKWAEPDINQASRYLKQLFENKEMYNHLKKNAKEYIENEFSMEKMAERINNRIQTVIKENNL